MVLTVDEETARLSVVVKVESFLRSQVNYFFWFKTVNIE